MDVAVVDFSQTEIEFVRSADRLAELCGQWRGEASLAVDTEFVRTDTFYPNLGLIQVSDGVGCWLVDPLAIEDLSPFAALLTDPTVMKVFHACSEDLEVLRHHLNVLPSPMLDTQLAAAFVGYGFSRGYAALVGEVIEIDLPKHETRSDWLQRPLSESQCRYAAEDVFYLAHVYQHLLEMLSERDRLGWVEQDILQLLAKAASEENPNRYYLKVKGAWQLQRNELAILRALTSWRECEARERNRPRNRVINDRLLWEIARCKPDSHRGLSQVPEMHPRVQRQYGDKLIAMIAEALNSDPEHWPARLPKPLPRVAGDWLKRLRSVQAEIADELGLAREVLARKKDLEDIVGSYLAGKAALPEHWLGTWREEVLGEALLTVVSDTH